MNLTGQPVRQKPPKSKSAKAHMAWVAQIPCVICGAWPVEVHHCISDRYGQSRVSDWQVIPLCPPCHRTGPLAIHRDKAAWEERNGKDWRYLEDVWNSC